MTAGGTLSDGTRIDVDGTTEEAIPHTNAVVHVDDTGSEVVTIAFAGTSMT